MASHPESIVSVFTLVHDCCVGAAVGAGDAGMDGAMGLPALGGYGALAGGLGLAMHHPQSPSVFMKMQTPDLDAGTCWYDHDVPPTLGVADIFSDDTANL